MKKQKVKKNKSGFSIFLIAIDVIAIICFFVAYGPFAFFRDWFVTTSMTTMTHKYFAYTLYALFASTLVITTDDASSLLLL